MFISNDFPRHALPLNAPCDNAARGACGLPASSRIGRQLAIEATKAGAFGKPMMQRLLGAIMAALPVAPRLLDRLENWPGNIADDAVVFRLAAGFHALHLAGKEPALAAFYDPSLCPSLVQEAAAAQRIRDTLLAHEDAIAAWLVHTTQTNEVARTAGLVAVLRTLNAQCRMACDVLELGCSAGLNLNFPHYTVVTGSDDNIAAADPGAVRIAPRWHGPAVPASPLVVERAAGVDVKPLSLADPGNCHKLRAYIWPDDTERQARLVAAINVAHDYPPAVEQGHAGSWLERQLAAPQRAGVRRVVFHSMALQYVLPAERDAIERALEQAGARASAARPLIRLSFEWNSDRTRVELGVTQWDGSAHSGMRRVAAICHPYGEWLEWLWP